MLSHDMVITCVKGWCIFAKPDGFNLKLGVECWIHMYTGWRRSWVILWNSVVQTE